MIEAGKQLIAFGRFLSNLKISKRGRVCRFRVLQKISAAGLILLVCSSVNRAESQSVSLAKEHSPLRSSAQEALPNYFPLKKGCYWKYRGVINPDEKERSQTCEGVKTVLNEGSFPDGSTWHQVESTLNSELNGLKTARYWFTECEGWIYQNDEKSPRSGRKVFKTPLTSGFSWNGPPARPWRGPLRTEQLHFPGPIEGTVSGPEEIIVPAGKFLALKVVKGHWAGCFLSHIVSWYAPGVGLIKEETSGGPVSKSELIEFKIP
ncbi:MAG: hypothetical protein KGS72_23490 [Cyanobacteria bacterium REEB67]|nr:hypothetical protein [Cyanobacteria bacterium REEB67]